MTDALLHPVYDTSRSAPDNVHCKHPPITVERVSPAAVSRPQRGDNYKCDTRIWKCLFINRKGDLNLGNAPLPQSSLTVPRQSPAEKGGSKYS